MIKPLTPAGKVFFALANLMGGSLFVWSFIKALTYSSHGPSWGYLGLFLATLSFGFFFVKIPGINSLVSISDSFIFSAVMFYGPAPAALLAGMDGFLSTRRHSERLLSAISTLSVLTVSVFASGLVYQRLLAQFCAPGESPRVEQLIVPVGAMALTHYILNSWLVATLTAYARRLSVYATWKEHYLWTSLSFFSGAFAAALAYVLIQRIGPAAFLIAIPILGITYLTYRTYLGRVEEKNRRIAEMNTVHLDTIEALAMAIDAKGQTTYGHLRRVQVYAVGLAELVGVDERTLEGIRAGALLHDVGKLAVPDYILNKPGPLSEAERKKLRTYPRIGADILSKIKFPYPVIPMIRYHQERWDGTGYPEGLAGEEIPLGARIIAIADCADAMRCPRAYRPIVPREDMVEYMRGEGGTHFDPALVATFCDNLDQLEARAEGVEVPKMDGMEEIASIHREHAATLYEEETSRSVLTDISASRNEALTLYDLAKDLGTSFSLKDTLAILMDKLRSLLSFDTGAVYLVEHKTGLIIPAAAEGWNVEIIRRKSFRRGEGITGWVVDNSKSMVHQRPELDFYGLDVEVGRQYRSAAVVPLIVAGTCIGTITLYDRREHHFGTEDERILDLVAPQAAGAIQNARSFEENRDRALTDALTGLPNSRYLYMQLEQELSRARRGGRPLGIVVLDLDRFKPINDTFGHHIGDEVLKEVARCLVQQFRGSDSVCRWAGDEFVVLLPESDPHLVETTVLRAQRTIEEVLIPTSAGRTVQVGASAGWAVFPIDGQGFEELMRVADKRMYRNKTERRESGQTTVV